MGFSCNCDTNGEQFDRKGAMVANGWRFSGLDKNSYFGKDKHRVCGEAPDTAYCGWSRRKNGFVSKTLTGSGTLTIDFGNPSRKGTTIVELDGKEIARARKRQQRSHTVPFSDQQRLTIREVGGGIIVLTGLIMTSCEDGVQAQAFSSTVLSSTVSSGEDVHHTTDGLAVDAGTTNLGAALILTISGQIAVGLALVVLLIALLRRTVAERRVTRRLSHAMLARAELGQATMWPEGP